MPTSLDLEGHFRDLDSELEISNCGLIARDPDGTVVFVNNRVLEWLQYDVSEIIGRPMSDLVPKELRGLAELEIKAASEGDVRARLAVAQRKDSTTFPVLFLPERMLDSKGNYVGSVSILVDLGTIMTAKQVGYEAANDVRGTLHRIAMELQSISLTAGAVAGGDVSIDHPDLDILSTREKEVLAQLLTGDRVPSIAKELHISQHTVRNHLKSMFRKLDVNTQSELIHFVRGLAGA